MKGYGRMTVDSFNLFIVFDSVKKDFFITAQIISLKISYVMMLKSRTQAATA